MNPHNLRLANWSVLCYNRLGDGLWSYNKFRAIPGSLQGIRAFRCIVQMRPTVS